MEFKELILYIENHGISIIFTLGFFLTFYRYFSPFMREVISTQKEMKKIIQSMNMNIMRGKGLEMVLNLKIQEIRWALQKKIIQYIIDNNIALNWNIILKEIDLKLEEKKHDMYTELRDIVDKFILKVFLTKLEKELLDTKVLIIQLLEELKNNGKEDRQLYVTAQRAVETHFEHFENRMHNEIKNLLN